MKKNILYYFSASAILLTSCIKEPDEIHPTINFDDFSSVDTTYVITPAPAAQVKNILIEESTGVRCTNCPFATELIHILDKNNSDRIDLISIHYGGGPLNEPHHDLPTLDLRPDGTVGTNYINLLGGVNSQPAAAVDRTPVAGNNSLMNNRTFWADQVNSRVQEETPVNLKVSLTDQPSQNRVLLDFEIVYNKDQETAAEDYFSLVLMESDIIGVQDSTASVVLNPYTFNEVFRRFIGPVSGEKITVARQAGRVIARSIAIPYDDFNSDWVVSNLSIALFVHKNDANSKEVLNSRIAHIK